MWADEFLMLTIKSTDQNMQMVKKNVYFNGRGQNIFLMFLFLG